MGRPSRDKGKRGEREVTARYKAAGFDAERTGYGQAHRGTLIADVTVRDARRAIHVEVKRQERVNIWAAYAQAQRDAPTGAMPILHFRRNGSEWMVALKLSDFLALL